MTGPRAELAGGSTPFLLGEANFYNLLFIIVLRRIFAAGDGGASNLACLTAAGGSPVSAAPIEGRTTLMPQLENLPGIMCADRHSLPRAARRCVGPALSRRRGVVAAVASLLLAGTGWSAGPADVAADSGSRGVAPTRPSYRLVQIPIDANGLPTMKIVISPSAIRAKRLAQGLKAQDVEFPELPPSGEGGIAGTCPPVVVSHTNSSFTGGSYVLQGGFAEGEAAAASYTLAPSEFPARFESSEMIFGTDSASQQTTTEWSLLIIEGEPATGLLAASFSSIDGDLPPIVIGPGTAGVNVLVVIDPSDPEQIFLGANALNAISVGYQIDDHNAQTQNPCFFEPPSCCNAFPATDTSGLAQPTKNWLFAINCGPFGCASGWKKFSQLGLCTPSGDWVLRMTYTGADCVPVAGACCLPGGTCELLDSAECLALGGNFAGANTICEQINCQPVTGACCFGNGTCANLTSGQCQQQGGTYKGDNTTCATQSCPEIAGPCCFAATGNCISLKASQCLAAGGVAGPPGVSCAGYTCFPKGACCLPDGTCAGDVTPEQCAALSGLYQGNSSSCAQVVCPDPVGACCFTTGFCLELTELECGLTGSLWGGIGSTCTDANSNGVPDSCESPGLVGDLNGDGKVDGADLGVLLSQWGSGGSADLNGDGVVNGADLGILLAAWTG